MFLYVFSILGVLTFQKSNKLSWTLCQLWKNKISLTFCLKHLHSFMVPLNKSPTSITWPTRPCIIRLCILLSTSSLAAHLYSHWKSSHSNVSASLLLTDFQRQCSLSQNSFPLPPSPLLNFWSSLFRYHFNWDVFPIQLPLPLSPWVKCFSFLLPQEPMHTLNGNTIPDSIAYLLGLYYLLNCELNEAVTKSDLFLVLCLCLVPSWCSVSICRLKGWMD